MASNDYAIVPTQTAKTAPTSATLALHSVTLLVPGFIVNANGGNSARVYLGDSTVASTKGISLSAGTSVSFLPYKRDRNESSSYDLNLFYIRATAASQVVTITRLDRAIG